MNINYQQSSYQNDNFQIRKQALYPQSNIQQQTLSTITPVVQHGLREAQHLGYQHALREAVAIGYLMGRGYDFNTAWRTVESWWRPPGASMPTTPY
ncbi:hypothetical protein J6TS2_51410 [Heyndrickxia sporothermodurans]|nr:hypothetical protein J6TS2_51410 [Heyndrickxia sporothermodurans]